MSRYRGSGHDYTYDDYYGGSQRWDRDRFERMRSRGAPPGGESIRYDEDDRYYSGGGEDRRIRVDVDEGRRGGYSDRSYYEDDRYYSSPRRSRPDYVEEDRYRSGGREMASYRRDYEKDYNTPPRSRSSLDGYDRRPAPRYNDDERDINVNLHVTPPQPPRQYREYDYSDSPRARDSYAEEDYRDVNIRRETERSTYRRYDDYDRHHEEPTPPSQSHYHSKRGRTRMPKRLVHRNAILQKGYPFDELEDFYIVRTALGKDQIDEVIKISESYFRESESHSRSISTKVDETKMIAAPEPEQEHGHGHEHEHEHEHEQEGGSNEIVETTTTKVIENPTQEDIEKYSQATQGDQNQNIEEASTKTEYSRQSNKSKSHYSHHSHHSEHNENGDEEEQSSSSSDHTQTKSKAASKTTSKGASHSRRQSKASNYHNEGEYSYNEEAYNDRSTTVVALPERRKEKDIKAEIRALENERRDLKQKADRETSEYEIWQVKDRESNNEEKERDVVRVEKDSREDRGKFLRAKSTNRDGERSRSRSRRRPSQKVVNAALFSLT